MNQHGGHVLDKCYQFSINMNLYNKLDDDHPTLDQLKGDGLKRHDFHSRIEYPEFIKKDTKINKCIKFFIKLAQLTGGKQEDSFNSYVKSSISLLR